MKQVSEKLFVGSLYDYNQLEDGEFVSIQEPFNFSVIHALKVPAHQDRVGYKGNLNPNHKDYSVVQDDNDLYLNIVDSEREYTKHFGDILFLAAFIFIDHRPDKNILIYCNQGKSRSASIALAYLARKEEIGNISYEHAYKDFMQLYPDYCPGNGVRLYMTNNWDWLMNG